VGGGGWKGKEKGVGKDIQEVVSGSRWLVAIYAKSRSFASPCDRWACDCISSGLLHEVFTNTTCTRTHTHTHTHTHKHKHAQRYYEDTHTHTHTVTQLHTHTHTHTAHTCKTQEHTHSDTNTHIHTRAHTHTHTRAHTHTHTPHAHLKLQLVIIRFDGVVENYASYKYTNTHTRARAVYRGIGRIYNKFLYQRERF
jgi:hypothetical protein